MALSAYCLLATQNRDYREHQSGVWLNFVHYPLRLCHSCNTIGVPQPSFQVWPLFNISISLNYEPEFPLKVKSKLTQTWWNYGKMKYKWGGLNFGTSPNTKYIYSLYQNSIRHTVVAQNICKKDQLNNSFKHYIFFSKIFI